MRAFFDDALPRTLTIPQELVGRALSLVELANKSRQHVTQHAALHTSVLLLLHALPMFPAGEDPELSVGYAILGIAMRAKFELTGDPHFLDAAVDAGRNAVAACPSGHPGRAFPLSELANSLRIRSERTGSLADLDEAVAAARDAAAATHPTIPNGRGYGDGHRRRARRSPTSGSCWTTSAASCFPGSSAPAAWATWTRH